MYAVCLRVMSGRLGFGCGGGSWFADVMRAAGVQVWSGVWSGQLVCGCGQVSWSVGVVRSAVINGEGPSSPEVVLDLLQRAISGLRNDHGREQDVDHADHAEEQEGNEQAVAILLRKSPSSVSQHQSVRANSYDLFMGVPIVEYNLYTITILVLKHVLSYEFILG